MACLLRDISSFYFAFPFFFSFSFSSAFSYFNTSTRHSRICFNTEFSIIDWRQFFSRQYSHAFRAAPRMLFAVVQAVARTIELISEIYYFRREHATVSCTDFNSRHMAIEKESRYCRGGSLLQRTSIDSSNTATSLLQGRLEIRHDAKHITCIEKPSSSTSSLLDASYFFSNTLHRY